LNPFPVSQKDVESISLSATVRMEIYGGQVDRYLRLLEFQVGRLTGFSFQRNSRGTKVP